MAEVGEVRRRLRWMIERARASAADRRARAEADAEVASRFLREVATPAMRQVAAVLHAEGFEFRLSTPPESVRLVSERQAADYVDLAVDATTDPVTIATEVSHVRGRRISTVERPLAPGVPLGELTEEHVLAFLTEALVVFVER